MRRFFRWIPNAYLMGLLAVMYLPTAVVVAYSFNKQKDGLMWTGFTVEWYEKLMTSTRIREAMTNSLIIAGLSCAIAAVIGTLGAVALARSRFKLRGALEAVASVPIMLPEIVLGIAFMVAFSLLGVRTGMLTLVLSHATFCIPYVLILVSARLNGLDPAYEEAARDLGATPARALLTVIIPLTLPAILSGVLLAFAMSLDDFIISFFVNGTTQTYPLYVYSKVKTDIPPTVNAMCSVMLGITFVVIALSRLLRGKRKA